MNRPKARLHDPSLKSAIHIDLNSWTLDILRQGAFDLWVAVCLIACATLIAFAIARPAMLLHSFRPFIFAGLLAGTAIVLITPSIRTPIFGMIWTIVLLGSISVLFYGQMRANLRRGPFAVLLSLRLLAILLAVPMLFEPVLRFRGEVPHDRPLLFLVDSSFSMSIPEIQNGPTRIQSAARAIDSQLDKIRKHFSPEFFCFDSHLQSLPGARSVDSIPATGRSTDIVGSLHEAEAFTDRDDAAVVLLTDGIDNVSPQIRASLKRYPHPIHTLTVGSSVVSAASAVNVAISDVDPPSDCVVHHASKIKFTVQSTGLAGRVVSAHLAELDANQQPVGEVYSQTLPLTSSSAPQAVEFPYTPTVTGMHRLAIWIDALPDERLVADNRQEFQLLALDPRIRVLYIEGRARPESQQLSRALARDQNIELASLIRIQQDRFSASGSADGVPIKSLPSTLEQWKHFDVILIGDLDSSFLSASQQTQIEQAVSGGLGFIMVGGQTTFGPGGYQNTPIEKLLPVQTGDLSAEQEKRTFVPQLTAQGETHPAMQGLADWFGTSSSKPTNALPSLRGNVVVPAAKTGAEVLLVHPAATSGDSAQVVLAVQRYGQGRSAAFTADTTYLWYLPLRTLGQQSPYNKFWGQLIRWLANEDVKNRQQGAGLDLLISKNRYTLGQPISIRALVRDDKGDATRYAQLSLILKSSDGKVVRQLPMAPSESRAGLYDANVPPPIAGDWTVDVSAEKEGKTIGKKSLSFSVLQPDDELSNLTPNDSLLAGIAQDSKGLHYSLADFPNLIDELIRAKQSDSPAIERSIPLANFARTFLAAVGKEPRWNHNSDLPMQAVLVFLTLCTEWALRRKWQLN